MGLEELGGNRPCSLLGFPSGEGQSRTAMDSCSGALAAGWQCEDGACRPPPLPASAPTVWVSFESKLRLWVSNKAHFVENTLGHFYRTSFWKKKAQINFFKSIPQAPSFNYERDINYASTHCCLFCKMAQGFTMSGTAPPSIYPCGRWLWGGRGEVSGVGAALTCTEFSRQ